MKFLTFVIFLFLFSFGLHAEERVALIIGNSNYENEKSLKNPINDAIGISNILKNDLGFSYVKLLKNVKRRDFINELALFKDKAKTADTIVFYYSGHGQQNSKSNYLLPTDAKIDRVEHIKPESIDVDDIVSAIETTQSKVNLIILDACRDNPFSLKTKSLSKGLSRPNNLEEGTLIAFATADGDIALDGNGNDKNSPYAQALITNLKNAKKIPIQQILDNVSDQVKAATNGMQKPKRYGDMKMNVYLVEPNINNSNSNQKIEFDIKLETEYWSSIKNSGDIADFLSYTKKFPTGAFKELAENAIARLKKNNKSEVNVSDSNSINLSAVTDTVASTTNENVTENTSSQNNSSSKLKAGDLIKDCLFCPELVVIPRGKFLMGSNETEVERRTNEEPVKEIKIDYDFAVGKFEITKKEFSYFVEQTNYKTDAENNGGCTVLNEGYRFIKAYWEKDITTNWRRSTFTQNENHPVICISWLDAKAYIKWINSLNTDKKFRLLSDSEWEYVARATTNTAFSTGNTISDKQANMDMYLYYDKSPRGSISYGTKEVGHYQPNIFGIYDMHGNVAEIVQDTYVPNLNKTPSDGQPYEAHDNPFIVVRGGGWWEQPVYGRSASRQSAKKGSAIYYAGFRIARNL